jgi:glyceraldehyde-3-phosphate dehydrogenase type I
MKRIVINGFGRIGRNFLRGLLADPRALEKVELVGINIGKPQFESAAYLFKYDSLLGTYSGHVALEDNNLVIDSLKIPLFAELDPLQLPWKKLSVDWVVESSGKFTTREGAEKHIQAGARAVLITAPATGEDVSIIPGVNNAEFNPEKDKIVSLGSCTTNAFIPMVHVLHKAFGIKEGVMTTIHSYTNSQPLLDTEHKDLRRSRAAAINIIPTSTGAAGMMEKLMPELKGKITACAVRVPVPKISLIDFGCITESKCNVQDVNKLFESAARDSMKGIIAVTHEPLVSSDFMGISESVCIDALMTQSTGSMIKVFGWYDNEWSYGLRLKDFLVDIA